MFPTCDDGVFVLEGLLNGREANGPDVAIKRSGSIDLNNGNVVLVSVQLEIPVHSYLRNHEIQCTRFLGFGKIVLAESHRDVTRFVPKTTAHTWDNCNSRNCSFYDYEKRMPRVYYTLQSWNKRYKCAGMLGTL